ncbi:phage tail protein [Xenorhabdus nematophila]|uniref:phage tail protein n=1 Tax=Xenorhabdus nematophila TaxID=628 RepID=UPI0032B7BD74
MTTKYFALLTRLGADKLANAAALGTKLDITHMAIGDGGGTLPTPDTAQTKLVNERRRAAINVLSVDPKNTHQIIAEQVIPESEGGWWIREIGLFDKDGILIAVGNCAETYKPQLQEGSGRTQTLRMVLIVSHADAVTLKIDPSVVLATREYADALVKKAMVEHEKSRRHPDATLKEKGFVILSSAVDSNSETQAATPRAVKAAYDLATAANNNANGRVPSARKVNGKALSADISLNAGDVDAYTKRETDSRVDNIKTLVSTANQNAVNANNNANNRLEKSKNGADIPNKKEFVENLGLSGTVELAENAQPAGDYADKSATNKQIFASFVSSSRGTEADDNNGNRIGMYAIDGRVYLAAHRNNKWIGDVEYPNRGGQMALRDELYGMAAYRDVTTEREINVTYINRENRPIYVSCTVERSGSYRLFFFVNGVVVAEDSRPPGIQSGRWAHHISAIVPASASYRVFGDGDSAELTRWMEL